MSLTKSKKISLDFYNQNIITVNAKQNDSMERCINITCTDHGKKVALNSDNMSAFIRYKKIDGTSGFKLAEILSDGTILLVLQQQMLTTVGRQVVDVVIAAANGISVDNLSDIQDVSELNVTIISTMSFYLNVCEAVVDNSEIVSVSDMDGLNVAISNLVATEAHMKDLENTLTSNEEERKNNDIARDKKVEELIQTSEDKIETEIEKLSELIKNSEDATDESIKTTNEAKSLLGDVDDSSDVNTLYGMKTAMQEATLETKSATSNANEAAEQANTAYQTIKDLNFVTQDEKGVANGVASLNEDGVIPSEQFGFNVIVGLNETEPGTVLDGRVGKVLNDRKLSITGGTMTGELIVPSVVAEESLLTNVTVNGSLKVETENGNVDIYEKIVDMDDQLSNLYNSYNSTKQIGELTDGTKIYRTITSHYITNELVKSEAYSLVRITPSPTFTKLYSWNAFMIKDSLMYPIPYCEPNTGLIATSINKISGNISDVGVYVSNRTDWSGYSFVIELVYS